MNWQPIEDFAGRHKDGLELLGVAAIVTSRKTLPWPFNLVPPLEWAYEWARDAMMTLLSFRGPLPHPAEAQSSERITKQADGTVESVKETTVSGAVKDVQASKDEPRA